MADDGVEFSGHFPSSPFCYRWPRHSILFAQGWDMPTVGLRKMLQVRGGAEILPEHYAPASATCCFVPEQRLSEKAEQDRLDPAISALQSMILIAHGATNSGGNWVICRPSVAICVRRSRRWKSVVTFPANRSKPSKRACWQQLRWRLN